MTVFRELSPMLALAHRDFVKLLRDRARLISTLIFPFIFIGALGGALQSNFGDIAGYDFLVFTFTGVLAQTMFQTTALGLISLIEDRENDFSQEIFISPISRYTIIFGKIIGETLVAIPQGVAVLLFGLVIQVPISLQQAVALLVGALTVAIFGGAFGVMVLANLRSQRAANQIFPFVMLPQFFLAGVFSPIQVLPWYLDILSKLSPMRYAVDFARGLYYAGTPEYDKVVLLDPVTNFLILGAAFLVFMVAGTILFVRAERNR
ncbi:MAG: ABC transporter permease, partial [Candidatus Limnocylindria bacterium]|nr:ABC transporter permease [Chloroflexota bacterium]MDQ3400043.1 ABC transporter permease [Chloroflexota bacterium]